MQFCCYKIIKCAHFVLTGRAQDCDFKTVILNKDIEMIKSVLYRVSPKISPSVNFGVKSNISPVLFSGKHGRIGKCQSYRFGNSC